jgi:hypothetical protein
MTMSRLARAAVQHPYDPPALLIRVELEYRPKLVINADSWEDERRLRSWLREAGAIGALPGLIEDLLDDLDEGGRTA